MKKILISDYDQTFYLNDNDIEVNKRLVKEFIDLGNIFCINTGRSYHDLKYKQDIYNFEYDYAIINHGATIIDKDDNVISNHYIDNDIKNKLILDLDILNSIQYFGCNLDNSRLNLDVDNLTKIHVSYESIDKAMDVNQIINEKYGLYVNSYYVNKKAIEIISKDTNKSEAIKFLINKLGIDNNDVYTIGDSYSDIEMVKDFNGYCMSNSVDELRMVSKCEYDSVSKLIKDIINEEV